MRFLNFNTSLLNVIVGLLLSFGLTQCQDDGKESIYLCEFDSENNCDGTMTPSSLAKQISYIQSQIFTEDNPNNYKTDVSSITKPADNGLLCRIPFTLAQRIYYHCTANLECETTNGRIDRCFKGSFLGGKVNKRFTDRFVFNAIEIKDSAVYELNYFYFIYCPSEACNSARDYIQVILSHTDADGQKTEYKFTETYRKGVENNETRLWSNQSNYLQLEPGSLEMTVLFQRPVMNNNPAYLGFDSVSINKLDGSVTVPTPTTVEPLDDLSQYEISYECDFDSGDCGVQMTTNGYQIKVDRQRQISRTNEPVYYITDVSSITKPTEQNRKCKIPFYQKNVEYYHCTRFFTCETIESSLQDDCQQGKFLSGYLPSSEQVANASIKFPTIAVDESGEYAIEIYSFIICDESTGSNCETEDNSDYEIQIQLRTGTETDEISNKLKGKRWIRAIQYLNLEKDIEIEIKFVGYDGSNRGGIVYGIDQLRVYKISMQTTQTSRTTSESTGTTSETRETTITTETSTVTSTSTDTTENSTTSSTTETSTESTTTSTSTDSTEISTETSPDTSSTSQPTTGATESTETSTESTTTSTSTDSTTSLPPTDSTESTQSTASSSSTDTTETSTQSTTTSTSTDSTETSTSSSTSETSTASIPSTDSTESTQSTSRTTETSTASTDSTETSTESTTITASTDSTETSSTWQPTTNYTDSTETSTESTTTSTSTDSTTSLPSTDSTESTQSTATTDSTDSTQISTTTTSPDTSSTSQPSTDTTDFTETSTASSTSTDTTETSTESTTTSTSTDSTTSLPPTDSTESTQSTSSTTETSTISSASTDSTETSTESTTTSSSTTSTETSTALPTESTVSSTSETSTSSLPPTDSTESTQSTVSSTLTDTTETSTESTTTSTSTDSTETSTDTSPDTSSTSQPPTNYTDSTETSTESTTTSTSTDSTTSLPPTDSTESTQSTSSTTETSTASSSSTDSTETSESTASSTSTDSTESTQSTATTDSTDSTQTSTTTTSPDTSSTSQPSTDTTDFTETSTTSSTTETSSPSLPPTDSTESTQSTASSSSTDTTETSTSSSTSETSTASIPSTDSTESTASSTSETSTGTSFIPTDSTTSPVTTNLFSCSFDSGTACDATIYTENNIRTRVSKTELVFITGFPRTYYFTDLTSISNDTQKGDRCQIPFTLNNVQHYHCTQSYQCLTQGDNSLQRCANGFFLSAQTVSDQVAQLATVTFPTINVHLEGYYRLDYSAFLFCSRLTEQDCYSSQQVDFIELSIDNNGQETNLPSFSTKTREWLTKSEFLYLEPGNLTISVSFNRRTAVNNFIVLYGFDELRLNYLPSGTPSTTSTTTTTDTSTSVTSTLTSQSTDPSTESTFLPPSSDTTVITPVITDSTSTAGPNVSTPTSSTPDDLTTTTTTTPLPSTESLLFACSYDSNTPCGASTNSVNFSRARVSKSEFVTITGFPRAYYFTDLTSITNKTQKGDLCRIPFTLNNIQHYHCTQSSECITQTDSSIQRCAPGSFFSALTSSNDNTQLLVTTFPKMNIDQDGVYRVDFAAFLFCNRLSEQDCLSRQEVDFIELSVNNNGQETKLSPFSTKTREWLRRSETLGLNRGELTISVTFNRRVAVSNYQVLYGFDELRLYFLRTGTPAPTTIATTPTTPSQVTSSLSPISDTTDTTETTKTTFITHDPTFEPLTDYSTDQTTTTTPSQGPSTTTTPSSSIEYAFRCDFDSTSNTLCGASISSVNNIKAQANKYTLATIAGFPRPYYFTDVTSITNKTQRDDLCQIPFNLNGVQHYHCTQSYQCITQGDSSLQRCANGNFLSGSSSTSTLEQRANITFPTITIEKDGFYEIEYQAFIFCQRLTEQACVATAQDTDAIEVWVVNNDVIRKLQPFSIKRRQWSAQSDSISLSTGDLTISVIFKHEAQGASLQTLYGIDDLEVYRKN